MKKKELLLIACVAASSYTATAQDIGFTAQPKTDRIVPFKLSDEGIQRTVQWGADEAWIHEGNLRRCVLFMGKDNVDLVRVSFQPTQPLVDGDLQQGQRDTINERLRLLKFCKDDVKLNINCDHPSVHDYYKENAANWAALIDKTTEYFQKAGYEVVSISPFNEPDFGWNQWIPGNQDGTVKEEWRMAGFKQVVQELRKNDRFKDMRMCGGNTLNNDRALDWFNYLSDVIDEGNTHQLAGSFDTFAEFFTKVREAGKHATADEMHNVMEAMVGMEYGMQTGIWWGPAELARGEFCKAAHGWRLGYAEHRPNWTAASVYRAPDGRVQAFGGTSERQAYTTSYRFFSKDRDVYFNGQGPTREYVMTLPGGTKYQTGQTNAEQVVNITWGEDIQPVVNGKYIIVNRYSKELLSALNGTLTTETYTNAQRAQWDVAPVDSRCGGDFSYMNITSASTGNALDVLDWSLETQAEVILFGSNGNANQQWYLDYAGNGWFYIRNRHSSMCLAPSGDKLIQVVKADNAQGQLWRFLPVDEKPIITGLRKAPAQVNSETVASAVKLSWSKVEIPEPQTATYSVFRADAEDGEYSLIARGITDTTFTDHKVTSARTYYYKVKMVDTSLNTSRASEIETVTTPDAGQITAHYAFENSLRDTTPNVRHAAGNEAMQYTTAQVGGHSLWLNGTSNFVQLPTSVACSPEITIACWVRRTGTSMWERIFDFGNGEQEYMFLTSISSNNALRFAMKNGGSEEYIDGNALPLNTWTHVAVTIAADSVSLYENGKLIKTTREMKIRPGDFMPAMNYIGRSQFDADPLFKGSIDDFKIFNYALSGKQVMALYDPATAVHQQEATTHQLVVHQPSGTKSLEVMLSSSKHEPVMYALFNSQGACLSQVKGYTGERMSLNTPALPQGVYLVKASIKGEVMTQKVTIE